MTMGLPDRPELSVSQSRDRMMRECERRYYLHYYASWKGWERDADEATRTAYLGKKLQSLPTLLGTEVHERAREIANAIKEGREIPSENELIERTRARLNGVWRSSNDRESFIRHPSQHDMLAEKYFGMEVGNERLAVIAAKIRTLVTSLRAWPGWDMVRSCGADNIHLFDSMNRADFESVYLYATPDLVYGPSGDLTIVDWKTGREPSPEDRDQVALYYLFLRLRGFIADGERVKGRIVYLSDQSEDCFQLGENELEEARRRMADSLWRSRGFLVDMDEIRNEAVGPEHFPARIDEKRCHWCPMQDACVMGRPPIIGPF
jgi:hypothetical protein